MEKQIIELMESVFGVAGLDCTCSQKTCARWDSMNHLNLVLELEDAFGISLEPEEIGTMVDFNSVLEVVKSKI